MDTITILITSGITTMVAILVRDIWEWFKNKNGKKDIEDLKSEIKNQRQDFADLKNLILIFYLKKEEFEKHLTRFEAIRDITLKNENDISLLFDTVRQSIQRVSQLEK